MGEKHVSVLLNEAVEALAVKPDGIYVDGTFGRGGHSAEILKRLDGGRLICIDRDAEAFREAGDRFRVDCVSLVKGNFREMRAILDSLGIPGVDGILLDLGVSSPQLDESDRGFSYMHDAPLDMRMDREESVSAWNVVNRWSENELRRILYEYGEERYAPRIAAAICSRRDTKEIETTAELVDIIRGAMPAAALREKQHPAKRSFQAIRIAVNDELAAVREALESAPDCLNRGGRLAVISFHSLEDRIVKTSMASKEKGCTCPKNFPVCVCGFKQTLRVLTRKPILPTDAEISDNPRARSAKLRVAEKV